MTTDLLEDHYHSSSSNHVVQGFWHGAPFTTMERLCTQSFIANGHEFHLYVYDGNITGVPDNVRLCNAAEIVPYSAISTFRCAQQLSDYFRVKLLLDKGGWHTDLDNCLLRPLDFVTEHVFYRDYDESTISLALAKAPAKSLLLQHCYDYLSLMSSADRSQLSWQEIGSEFVCGAVEFFRMTDYAQSGRAFDPVHWTRAYDLVNPKVAFDLSQSYSVHLFHAAWNSGPSDNTGKGFDLGHRTDVRLNTDAQYDPACLYEQLKRRYGVEV